MLLIKRIETVGADLEAAIDLFKNYFKELDENLCFQDFEEELKYPLKKYGAPHGSLFIAYIDDKPAGCIALQRLNDHEVCEMKRLYVKPVMRGKGIAKELVNILLIDAVQKGYKKMVLDTLSRLTGAVKLYSSYGFIYREAYYNNPLPGVVYMEKQLV